MDLPPTTVGDPGDLLIADHRARQPLIERSIAWLTRNGHRRVRYRGVDRNHLALTIRAATLNLRRLCKLGLQWHDGWRLAT